MAATSTTPPPIAEKSTSGIAVDPRTLNRVVPESRRPDGRYVHDPLAFRPHLMLFHSIRKEIRIRPGFTPQEDVTRFRGTRQSQMDRIALPAGHILGWVAPSSASKPKPSETRGSTSKSAKKNEKRRGKRDKKKEEIIRANWEEDAVKDADGAPNWAETAKTHEPMSEHEELEEKKAVTEEEEQRPAVEANGDGEQPTRDEEDLDHKLEQLEIK